MIRALPFVFIGLCLVGVLWYGHVINRELRKQRRGWRP